MVDHDIEFRSMSFRLRGFVLFLIVIVLWAISERAEISTLMKGVQTSPSIVLEKTTQTTAQTSLSIDPEKKTETAENGEENGVQLPIGGESDAPDVDTAFHFCTKSTVPLADTTLKMEYWCDGPHYNEFGKAMKSLAATLPKPMGRRSVPLNANKHFLFTGNSHTQQMIYALVCQYSKEIVEYKTFRNVQKAFRVRFRNNSTITSLTNSPIMYSPEWKTLLEKGGIRLQSFDGIVLGKFNRYDESIDPAYIASMDKQLARVPGDIQYATAIAPVLSDVASVFDGPIVYVGMFAKYGLPEQRKSVNFIQTARDTRDNLSVIDGRKYIEKMKMECGAQNTYLIGHCAETGDKTPGLLRPAYNLHRCTGDQGGHPDLIAWEVVEKLNAL